MKLKLVIMAVATMLVVSVASCGSSKSGVKHDKSYATNHSRKGGGSGIATRDDGGWSTLDIKLTSADNKRLYHEVKGWLGTPYLYAGVDKNGADCSGFVMTLYQAVYGKKLQRNSARMYERNCTPVSLDELQEGDLVFFNNGKGGGINHVGIYLRDGKFAHTSSSRGVMISDLNDRYFATHFYSGGRVKM